MKKILIAFAALALVLILATGALFYFRPIASFERLGRRALAGAGLVRGVVTGPSGPIEVWSGGSGPVVILVHGANDYAGTWARVAPALLARHRVVAFDLPGHGNSAPQTGPLSVGDLVAGIEAVVAKEQAPVTLVGNSLGGWLSLIVAKRRPEAVGHVVLVNGAATESKFADGIDLLPKDRASAQRVMAAAMAPGAPATPGFVLDDIVRRAPGSALARLQAKPIEREWFIDEAIPTLDLPVSILWGEADRVLPLEYARSFAPLFRRSRLETIPSCGHIPQRECPDALAAALVRALGAPPPPAASPSMPAEPDSAPGPGPGPGADRRP